MERVMARMGRGDEVKPSKRILELNSKHPVVQRMQRLAEQNPPTSAPRRTARLLLDQATIAEGSRIKDPPSFARRLKKLMSAPLAAAT